MVHFTLSSLREVNRTYSKKNRVQSVLGKWFSTEDKARWRSLRHKTMNQWKIFEVRNWEESFRHCGKCPRDNQAQQKFSAECLCPYLDYKARSLVVTHYASRSIRPGGEGDRFFTLSSSNHKVAIILRKITGEWFCKLVPHMVLKEANCKKTDCFLLGFTSCLKPDLNENTFFKKET